MKTLIERWDERHRKADAETLTNRKLSREEIRELLDIPPGVDFTPVDNIVALEDLEPKPEAPDSHEA